jgi:hypothetical protein
MAFTGSCANGGGFERLAEQGIAVIGAGLPRGAFIGTESTAAARPARLFCLGKSHQIKQYGVSFVRPRTPIMATFQNSGLSMSNDSA